MSPIPDYSLAETVLADYRLLLDLRRHDPSDHCAPLGRTYRPVWHCRNLPPATDRAYKPPAGFDGGKRDIGRKAGRLEWQSSPSHTMTRATVDAQTGNTLRAQERDSRRRLGGAMRAGHARMLSVRPASRQSGKADSFGVVMRPIRARVRRQVRADLWTNLWTKCRVC